MLANRMTDDSSDSNESSSSHSSEPHVVVACPSCKTKFAVESSLVASYEIPKFHCSRCDLVFQLNRPSHQNTRKPNVESDSQRWVLSDGPHHEVSNPFSQPRQSSATLKSTDFTLGEAPARQPQGATHQFAPLEERAGLSLLGLRPSAGQTISSAITRRETINRTPGASAEVENTTHANTQDEDTSELDPFSLFDPPSAQSQVVDRPSSPNPATQRATPTPTPEKPTAARPQPLATRITTEAPAHTAEFDDNPNPPNPEVLSYVTRTRLIASKALSKLSARNRNLVQLSTPLILLAGACCIVSYASAFAPKTSDVVFRSIVPSLITGKVSLLPPAELLIQGVTIEFEKTQSKETIPVIRGVVLNSGNTSVEDVLIEALGFNAQGEVVSRAKAPLWSALDREKISDIPLSTVEKYQTSLRAPNANIRAGERVSFTVALLPSHSGEQAISYFSARIFSVGRARR